MTELMKFTTVNGFTDSVEITVSTILQLLSVEETFRYRGERVPGFYRTTMIQLEEELMHLYDLFSRITCLPVFDRKGRGEFNVDFGASGQRNFVRNNMKFVLGAVHDPYLYSGMHQDFQQGAVLNLRKAREIIGGILN
jgi:hypothetical protein